MNRRFVVVFGQADIRKSGERIRFLNGLGSIEKPVRYVEAVIVMGKVSLSSDALSLLLSSGVPVFFLSKFGKLRGVLTSNILSSANTNRLRQYESFKRNRLSIARNIVSGKLKKIEEVFYLNLSHLRSELENADSIDSLMGIEGKASRLMFKRFRENIEGSGLRFRERSYHPPTDEVNALLSLAYSLTYALAFPVVLYLGYDPYLSFLHSKRGTHASFCSDIIEPTRPVLTKELENPIKRGLFSKKDFRKEGKGVYLRKESLPKFINWFEGLKEKILEEIKLSIISVGEGML